MEQLVKSIGEYLISERAMLVTAESCTGGAIAKAITDMAGSSQWFDRGFVTYSNAAKIDMLGVTQSSLEKYGAVSEPVAREMAVGALVDSAQPSYGISVTGIAGPSGGSVEKPVGMVCFGWAKKNAAVYAETQFFEGDRDEIRQKSVRYALTVLRDKIFNVALIGNR